MKDELPNIWVSSKFKPEDLDFRGVRFSWPDGKEDKGTIFVEGVHPGGDMQIKVAFNSSPHNNTQVLSFFRLTQEHMDSLVKDGKSFNLKMHD